MWESASSHAEERAKLLDSRLWIIMFADLSNWFVDRRVRAQGNALGMKSSKSRCALKGPGGPPFQGGLSTWPLSKGVASGWSPPRRWRDKLNSTSIARNFYKSIREIAGEPLYLLARLNREDIGWGTPQKVKSAARSKA